MSAKPKSHLISEETQYNTSTNSYYSNSNTSTINQTDKCPYTTSALNWREIMKIDLRLIHQTNDLTLLEDLLDNLVYGSIKQTDIPLIPEVNILKLIKVYQFTLNYLLTTQDKLEERIHSLERKNSAIQSDNVTKAVMISKLKKELKKHHQQQQQQQQQQTRYTCVYCSDKYFDNKELLDVHMERRHRINEVNEMKMKKREHKERVIEYKLDFLQKQFEELYLQSKFRKGNEKGKVDSMRLMRMMEDIDEKVDMNIKELKLLCKKLAVNKNGSEDDGDDRYSYNVDKVSMLIEEINMQNKKRIDLYQSVISKELASIKEEMIMNNTFMLRNQYYNCYNDNMMMNRCMNDDVSTHTHMNVGVNNKCIVEQQQQQLCGNEQIKHFSRNRIIVDNNQTNEFTLNNNNNNNNVVIQTQTIEIHKQNSNSNSSNNKNNHPHSKQPSSSSLHIQSNKSQIKKQSIKSIINIPETQNLPQSHSHSHSHHSLSKRNNTNTNNNNDLNHNSSNTNSNNTNFEKELTPKDLLTIFHSQYINRDNDITSNPSLTNLTKHLT